MSGFGLAMTLIYLGVIAFVVGHAIGFHRGRNYEHRRSS